MNHRKPPPTTASTTNKYDTKQLLDILPSYISLYQSKHNPNSTRNSNPDRTAILKWFSSLTPPQRVAHLTFVDPTFTHLLLLMLRHVTLHPHVTFFVLPDLPSRDLPHSPTLLTRRTRGLLSRVAAESTRSVSSSLLLFSSREEDGGGAATKAGPPPLDTVSLRENFVAKIENFVEAMDEVTKGGFLRGEEWEELGLEWAEMRWLKGRGYYSMEEFVANRVEVALRTAWLSGGGGRKRGVKVKEKAKNVVGLGVNVYWRKRGCVDWWYRLELGFRKSVFRTVLGTAAKCLV